MSYPFPPDIAARIEVQLSSGEYASEDDLLREALDSLAEQKADLAAVREAIELMDAGDPGIPVEEAFRRIITRHEQS